MLYTNVVSVEALEGFIGKANHVAGVLAPWRPFLQEVWAALSVERRGEDATAPTRCVWVRRFEGALHWFHASFEGLPGTLQIDYPVRPRGHTTAEVCIQTDAGP